MEAEIPGSELLAGKVLVTKYINQLNSNNRFQKTKIKDGNKNLE
jgi:hypothetical protein